ncbi:MAG: 50S ribosomal protein L21 [Bacteroidetes bacterium]|nr:50S ribosomal protein L21 [Bacteroidota bacterium]
MYAIVEIAGQQFKVERGNKVYVHRLQAKEGDKLEFDKVLLVDNGGKVQVGTPTLDGARVAATVIGNAKGDKVLVFKKKRRKTYQKMNGHRQLFTQILIQGILAKGETLKDELKVEKKQKPLAKKAEVKEVKAVEKALAVKKAPAKKAAAKKTTKKKED